VSAPDPTLQPALVKRLQGTLQTAEVADYLDSLKQKRISLVLSGGGGKGAYEAGAILALFDCGIRTFCAISGTSVGALNAVLCHELCRTGDRSQIINLWTRMSFSQIAKLEPWRLPFVTITAALRILAALPHFLSDLLQRSIDHNSVESERYSASRFASVNYFFLLMCCSIYWLLSHFLDLSREWFILVATVIVSLIPLFRNWFGRHLSWLSNRPLRKLIAAIDLEPVRQSAIPIYCTLAKEVEWWDPFEDHSSWQVSDDSLRKSTQAIYLRLGDAGTTTELRKCLLQTTAIPELFPRRSVGGQYVVDGGIADNVPILPVCMHEPDMLIVVYLKHALHLKMTCIGAKWLAHRGWGKGWRTRLASDRVTKRIQFEGPFC
jgi:predicted acylesterase/phospholipase RssA